MNKLKVEILLPLTYNPEGKEEIGKKIPEYTFHKTYEELLKIAGGVSTNFTPVKGSWICLEDRVRYDDQSVTLMILRL